MFGNQPSKLWINKNVTVYALLQGNMNPVHIIVISNILCGTEEHTTLAEAEMTYT